MKVAMQDAIVHVPNEIREAMVAQEKNIKEQQESLPSLTSHSSVASYDSDETDDLAQAPLGNKKTVRFQEAACDIIPPAQVTLTDPEADTLWYTRDEIIQFHENCQRMAGTILRVAQLADRHDFWTHRLERDYHAFCTHNNAELEATILGSPTAFHSIAVHGLALWVMPTVEQDLQHRVQAQRDQIMILQTATSIPNATRRAEMIRRAACTWSRPARLLARHLGQAAATAVVDP